SALVYTYPLILHFGEAIPYACAVSPERRVQGLVPGDPLQFLYFLSVTDDMVHGRAPWFQDPYEFSAPEPSRRRSFFFLPFSLLFALAAPFGLAAAYNLLVVLSFPATALAGHLLARSLGAGPLAAGVAAAALTLLPYRVANVAGGHPTGIAFFLLPLGLYLMESAWQTASRRAAPTRRWPCSRSMPCSSGSTCRISARRCSAPRLYGSSSGRRRSFVRPWRSARASARDCVPCGRLLPGCSSPDCCCCSSRMRSSIHPRAP